MRECVLRLRCVVRVLVFLVGGLRAFCVLVCVTVLCFCGCFFVVDFFLEQGRPFACVCLLSLSRFARAVLRSSLFFAASCCGRACVPLCLGRVLPLFPFLSPFCPHSLPLPLLVCSGQSCHWSLLRLLEWLSINQSINQSIAGRSNNLVEINSAGNFTGDPDYRKFWNFYSGGEGKPLFPGNSTEINSPRLLLAFVLLLFLVFRSKLIQKIENHLILPIKSVKGGYIKLPLDQFAAYFF